MPLQRSLYLSSSRWVCLSPGGDGVAALVSAPTQFPENFSLRLQQWQNAGDEKCVVQNDNKRNTFTELWCSITRRGHIQSQYLQIDPMIWTLLWGIGTFFYLLRLHTDRQQCAGGGKIKVWGHYTVPLDDPITQRLVNEFTIIDSFQNRWSLKSTHYSDSVKDETWLARQAASHGAPIETYTGVVHIVPLPIYVTITALIFSFHTSSIHHLSIYLYYFSYVCVFFAFYVTVCGCLFWL